MAYQTLMTKIQDTLQTVAAVKAVYPYPATNLEQYPAVIFFPTSFDNTFQSTADNMKVYRFALYIVIGATQKNIQQIFSTVLPKTVDAVLAAFDENWNAGTINGHRVWTLINSGNWAVSVAGDGLEAVAELTVEVRLATTN